MRFGIISDIHSNLEALQQVLEKLRTVDKMICPGDIVGYGPDPRECCDALRALDCATVLGNHDAAVADRMEMSWFNPDAGRAIRWTRETLDDDSMHCLKSLPVTHWADEFIVVHGSLKDPLEFPYIFSPSAARPCFEEMKDYTLCFVGHTHIAEVYVQSIGSFGADQLEFARGGKLDFRPGFRYIVNCGSVGQPRDGNKDASFGIYDSEADIVEIIRVPYDIGAVQSKMRAAQLPRFLIERLEYGE